MATITITGNTIREAGTRKDNRQWKFRSVGYQYGGGTGGVVTTGGDWQVLQPVAGVLTFTAEAGIAAFIHTPDHHEYLVRIPEEDAGLWDVIEAGIAFPPNTAQDQLNAAVTNALPPLVAAELEAQTADAISADLAEREITFTDEGDGEGYFSVGGIPVSGSLVPPAATRSGIVGIDGLGDSLDAHGLTAETADIGAVILAAVAAGKTHLVVPKGADPWPMTTPLTGDNALSDVWLEFEPGARISFDMEERAMDLTRCTLTNAYFTSDYTGPSSEEDDDSNGPYASWAREVRLNDGCVVQNYTHTNAAGGLNITAGNSISIDNATFSNIRHYKGWGAALHVSGAESFNIRATNLNIVDCDRAVEVEAGARNVTTDGGYARNIWPEGYTGQPGDYATYTFVLDAHSHEGESRCANVVHRNWVLEACGGGVTFVRSSGSNASDMPRNCLAENIRILGNIETSGYRMVTIGGYSNTVRDVVFEGGAGITTTMMIRVLPATENARIEDVRGDSYALPFIEVQDGAFGTIIDNVRPATPAAGSGYLIDVAARRTLVRYVYVPQVTGTSGFVRVQSTGDYSRIQGLDYAVHSGETFTAAVVLDGVNYVRVDGVVGSNYASSPPIDVQLTGATGNCVVTECQIDRSTGESISLGASTSRNLVCDNVSGSSGATITDAGTDNFVIDNLRGNSYGMTGTATLNFGALSANSHADLTITVAGATVGTAVALGVPTAAVTTGVAYTAWVSAADTVTVRAHNYTAGTPDPASGVFRATVVR